MHTVLIVIHVFLAVGLVGLILIQHGKGADAGAAFGSGASATVFGSQGSANFLSRTTAVFAAAFFLTSLALGWYAMQATAPKAGLMGDMDNTQVVPALPEMELPPAPEVEERSGQREVSAEVPDVPAAPVQDEAATTPSVGEEPVTATEANVSDTAQTVAADAAMQEGDTSGAAGAGEAVTPRVEAGEVTDGASEVTDETQNSN